MNEKEHCVVAYDKAGDSRSSVITRMGELIPRNDVAIILGVTKVTLWNWENLGILNPVKIGKMVFYEVIDIRSMMNKKGVTNG